MSSLAQILPEVDKYPPNAATGLLQKSHKGDGFNYLRFINGYLGKKTHVLVRFRRNGVNKNFLAFIQEGIRRGC